MDALLVPPETALDVTVIVPVLELVSALPCSPPVTVLEVIVTAPVLLLFTEIAKPPLPPVSVLALMMSIVPVEVFSIA